MVLTDKQAELLDLRLMGGADLLQPGKMIQELQRKVAANQPHSTATTVSELVADYNALIDKLVAAGLMEG
jgi:hypothetical protein